MEARISKESTPRRGIALVPAILIVSGLAIFLVALMTAVMSNRRTVVFQNEDYQVASAVESIAMLAAEDLWSDYLQGEGGAAGDIHGFRLYLTARNIADAGPGGPPPAAAGTSLLAALDLPVEDGRSRFHDVNVDAVQVVRRDVGDATQLFLTVSASTTRGDGIVNPVLNRAVQQVYTVEPAEFPGFEYALLANNVNCVFCHAQVDSALRYWNDDPARFGTFERVKVGSLESLQMRRDGDGNTGPINDYDADSLIAGTLYLRGPASDGAGALIGPADWGTTSLLGYPFDQDGNLLQDDWGAMAPLAFDPAGSPPDPLESLYLGYPRQWAEMVDGLLPNHFPPPFPDDGGEDPITGLPVPGAGGNKRIDDSEFFAVANDAVGQITAGVVNVTDPGVVIDSPLDYANAVFQGNTPGIELIHEAITGNVVLTGYPDNPIWIHGTLAIDGDLIIQGYVKGEGVIYVRGNVYIPTDLMYLDGRAYLEGDLPGSPTGPRTFGVAADGTRNALGVTAGGNVLIGDFQRPAARQPDGTLVQPGQYDIISGNPDTGDPMVDQWSFALAEIALFNRGEWARTQEFLPGPGGMPVANPGHVPGYVPRYYGYGEDTQIPIFNGGTQYFDPASGTWIGPESPMAWDTTLLSYADPNDPLDPYLFHGDGSPKAVTTTLTHTGDWMDPDVYKLSVEYFEGLHPAGQPMAIDGLLYTNNAIFSIVYRNSDMAGRMTVNGSLVAADVGMLVPGKKDLMHNFPNHSPLSNYAIGLQLNYDQRLKRMLNVRNPFQVQIKRTYWNPTANLL